MRFDWKQLNTGATTNVGDIMATYDAVKKLCREHRAREREWRKNATFAELLDELRVQEAISLNVFHPFTMGDV